MTGQLRGGGDEADLPALYRGDSDSLYRGWAEHNNFQLQRAGYGNPEAQRKVTEREGGQRKA